MSKTTKKKKVDEIKETVEAKETIYHDDGSRTVFFTSGIQWGESEFIEQITIQPPRGKHLKGMQVGIALTYDQYMNLVSKCSDIVSAAALDELHAIDNAMLIGEMSDFLESGPRIGKK